MLGLLRLLNVLQIDTAPVTTADALTAPGPDPEGADPTPAPVPTPAHLGNPSRTRARRGRSVHLPAMLRAPHQRRRARIPDDQIATLDGLLATLNGLLATYDWTSHNALVSMTSHIALFSFTSSHDLA